MKSGTNWEVNRTGATVRIDVEGAEALSETDRNAMIAAAEALLVDVNVSLLQLDGRALSPESNRGLADTVQALELLAEKHDKPLIVGPI